MKKALKRVLTLTLVILLVLPVLASAEGDYEIISPYADVIWTGDDAYTAYKGNLHTHSYVSDGKEDYRDMIMEYYRQGFGFLAMTDHGVTAKPWNEKPTRIPLFLYQDIKGNTPEYLSDEEYAAVLDGSYPVNGEARGFGMTEVPGGNELNALTVTEAHVCGLFLPAGVGNNHLGYENDHETAVRFVDDAGGLSFINHPGDFIQERDIPGAENDPKNVKYFSDILLRYDSCLGIEVFNKTNGGTPRDRILWDNLLMECLPYGKTVIGFSNGDSHHLDVIDATYSVFMMPDNSLENVKKTMQSGAFFAVTRRLAANEKLGPADPLNAANSDLPVPMFRDISVDGHRISVTVTNAYNIQWVGNGEIIAQEDITQSPEGYTYTLDLDAVEGSDELLYIRCQLLGEGGVTLTQAFVIDDGSAPLQYHTGGYALTTAARFLHRILNLRIFVLMAELVDLIRFG